MGNGWSGCRVSRDQRPALRYNSPIFILNRFTTHLPINLLSYSSTELALRLKILMEQTAFVLERDGEEQKKWGIKAGYRGESSQYLARLGQVQ